MKAKRVVYNYQGSLIKSSEHNAWLTINDAPVILCVPLPDEEGHMVILEMDPKELLAELLKAVKF